MYLTRLSVDNPDIVFSKDDVDAISMLVTVAVLRLDRIPAMTALSSLKSKTA